MKLNHNLIREISKKRHEPKWLLDWRLAAFDEWEKMTEPHWAEIDYSPIDYDSFDYYATQKLIDNWQTHTKKWEYQNTNKTHCWVWPQIP